MVCAIIHSDCWCCLLVLCCNNIVKFRWLRQCCCLGNSVHRPKNKRTQRLNYPSCLCLTDWLTSWKTNEIYSAHFYLTRSIFSVLYWRNVRYVRNNSSNWILTTHHQLNRNESKVQIFYLFYNSQVITSNKSFDFAFYYIVLYCWQTLSECGFHEFLST